MNTYALHVKLKKSGLIKSRNMTAKERIEKLKLQSDNKKKGVLNLIPWYYHFPRLSKYVPGLVPGQMYKILSFSGIN